MVDSPASGLGKPPRAADGEDHHLERNPLSRIEAAPLPGCEAPEKERSEAAMCAMIHWDCSAESAGNPLPRSPSGTRWSCRGHFRPEDDLLHIGEELRRWWSRLCFDDKPCP